VSLFNLVPKIGGFFQQASSEASSVGHKIRHIYANFQAKTSISKRLSKIQKCTLAQLYCFSLFQVLQFTLPAKISDVLTRISMISLISFSLRQGRAWSNPILRMKCMEWKANGKQCFGKFTQFSLYTAAFVIIPSVSCQFLSQVSPVNSLSAEHQQLLSPKSSWLLIYVHITAFC
jgi:hypothetical protein